MSAMLRLVAYLRTVIRRRRHCRHGEHRETVEPFGGYVLRRRCIDCGRTELLGAVVRGTNKISQHWPWERPDA